jgi:hypothetical protein
MGSWSKKNHRLESTNSRLDSRQIRVLWIFDYFCVFNSMKIKFKKIKNIILKYLQVKTL